MYWTEFGPALRPSGTGRQWASERARTQDRPGSGPSVPDSPAPPGRGCAPGYFVPGGPRIKLSLVLGREAKSPTESQMGSGN